MTPMKDFFDLAMIAGRKDLDGATLARAITAKLPSAGPPCACSSGICKLVCVPQFDCRHVIRPQSMKNGLPVSKNSLGIWCRPGEGYNPAAASLNPSDIEVVEQAPVPLPKSDQRFPKGAPIPGYFLVDAEIVKRL